MSNMIDSWKVMRRQERQHLRHPEGSEDLDKSKVAPVCGVIAHPNLLYSDGVSNQDFPNMIYTLCVIRYPHESQHTSVPIAAHGSHTK